MSKIVSVNSEKTLAEMKRMSQRLDWHRKGDAKRAVSAAINHSLSKSKTKIVRRVSDAMQIKQKYIRPRVEITRAKMNALNGKVWVGTNRFTARGAGAELRRNGHKVGPHKWNNTFSNKKLRNIYVRNGQGAGDIEVAGFDSRLTEVTLKRAVTVEFRNSLNKEFPVELFRQLTWRLDKALGIK